MGCFKNKTKPHKTKPNQNKQTEKIQTNQSSHFTKFRLGCEIDPCSICLLHPPVRRNILQHTQQHWVRQTRALSLWHTVPISIPAGKGPFLVFLWFYDKDQTLSSPWVISLWAYQGHCVSSRTYSVTVLSAELQEHSCALKFSCISVILTIA